MSGNQPNITIPVDLTNPGQFFACCGLLELADRLWPGAEGWFEGEVFHIRTVPFISFKTLFDHVRLLRIGNSMAQLDVQRLEELSAMSKKQRQDEPGAEDEKKVLESRRRESPIVLSGSTDLRIDWFLDDFAGGSRFKTWAGQQSVIDITTAMHAGAMQIDTAHESMLWDYVRGVGLPFNFDSDLGGQGSALDVGFSFDPLAASEATRIEMACKPALELLCFIGLQRFRPCEVRRENRFIFTAWQMPMPPAIAAAIACQAICATNGRQYEFRLLYRTKYLKSFLPASPFSGDHDAWRFAV